MTANTNSTNATTNATTSATTKSAYSLDAVKRVNQTAAFNRWLGFEVIRAEGGAAERRSFAWPGMTKPRNTRDSSMRA